MKLSNAKLLVAMTILLINIGALTACQSPDGTAANSNKPANGAAEKPSAGADKNAVNKIAANEPAGINRAGNQTDEKSSGECALTKAPVIKGFALGQTVEDIDRRVSGFKAAYDKEMASGIPANKKINFALITSGSPEMDKSILYGDELKNFSFIWHILDGKLMAYVVKDLRDKPSLANEVSKENNLPENGWKPFDSGSKTLTCQGFKVMITNGGQSGYGVMITDTQAEKEKNSRKL